MANRYFDNAATSHPKPPEVVDAVVRYMNDIGAPARGAYRAAQCGAAIVDRCREQIDQLVDGYGPSRVVFTHNATDALNLAIKGTLMHALASRQGRLRIVVTTVEHNSVLRPIRQMAGECARLELVVVDCDGQGRVDADTFVRAVAAAPTALATVCHASNVTGVIQPLGVLGPAVREASGGRAALLVDASQSMGRLPIDMRTWCIDLLAFPGHKGLLGPQGTGGLVIGSGWEERIQTVREGGTGQRSELEPHPQTLPEKFEAGSHNAAGIAGLSAGIAWIDRQFSDGENGLVALRRREVELTRQLVQGLAAIPGLCLPGPVEPTDRVGIVSFAHRSIAPAHVAEQLERRFCLQSRAGLHCAPLMHRAMGTLQDGATRLSLGPFHAESDIAFVIEAVAAVCGNKAAAAVCGEHQGRGVCLPGS